MGDKKTRRECKPRRGVLGIQPRTDRGSEITDNGFRDPIKPQRNGGPAETVLEQPDSHAQEKSRGWIAATETEIDGHEQGKVQKSSPCKTKRKPGLDHQREQCGNENRTGTKLVHLDVG